MQWSEYLGERYGRRYTLAHEGQSFRLDWFTMTPRIIENGLNGNVGMEISVEYEDTLLTTETLWQLGLMGDPNESDNARYLQSALSSMLPEAIHQAHVRLTELITQTEARLKTLTEIKAQLSYVMLFHGSTLIKLTLETARQILLIKAREEGKVQENVPEPFRLEITLAGTALVYDKIGRVIGHIGFNPTVEAYKSEKGRLGFYNVDPTEAQQ